MGIQQGKVRLVGAFDMMRERAEELTKLFGGQSYASMEELLSDPAVEAVVNLTTFQAHGEVTTKCLNAGKHVHSEKPLSIDPAEAQRLMRLGRGQGRRVGAAPSR